MCVFEQHNDVLSEISIERRQLECACLAAFVCLPVIVFMTQILCVCVCVCVCFCSAGNICMFKSNEAVKVSVDQSQAELNRTIDNIHSFLTTVPQVRGNHLN